VPVEVAATGPRVISAAARHADRVLLALGADPDRVRWGIETARESRRRAELDPDGVAFGAFVNVVCLPDIDAARDLARGGLSTFARFSVMHGEIVGPVSDEQAAIMHRLHDDYDMRSHTRADSAQAHVLSDEFVDSYAIVGPPDHCIARLRALAELGLDKLVIVGGTLGADRQAAAEADDVIAAHVLGNITP
jgi:5,10-methylenetetrahydromethanopterin reductase